MLEQAITKLSKDLKLAAATLTDAEARYLVDAYYIMQEDRKRAGNQVTALTKTGEPNQVIAWLEGNAESLENQIKRALDAYSSAHPVGQWLREIRGIGPVLSAGLLAHIDITMAPTVGHIWSFAGLNPSQQWGKGQKRPWNARFKTLCWKIGESFVKVSGHEEGYYGHVYAERKAFERAKNDDADYADQAKTKLENFKIGKDTDAYKYYVDGKLPPAHIHARAKRYAVKLFLSHLHREMYVQHYGSEPPLPYPIAILGHAHLR